MKANDECKWDIMLKAGSLESRAVCNCQTSETAMADIAAMAAVDCCGSSMFFLFDTSQNCCHGSEHAPPCIPKATPGCTIR